MISDRDLQLWIEFLTNQTVAFDEMHLVTTGEPHVADPMLVSFLKMNDGIVKEAVERAVTAFGESDTWPSSLTRDQIVNLTHRSWAARHLLLQILAGNVPRNSPALRIPRSDHRSKFIEWLFVDLCKRGGAAYLEALTNRFLADAGMSSVSGLTPRGRF